MLSEELKGKKVLVVDDQPDFRDAVAFEFEILDCVVDTAGDGLEAFEKSCSNKYDFVLSDIKMPKCDGIELIRKMKSNNKTHDVPFVFMTGFSDLRNYEAFELGANGYLGKPINHETLKRIFENAVIPLENLWRNPPNSGEDELIDTRDGTCVTSPEIQIGKHGMFLSEMSIDTLPMGEEGCDVSFDFMCNLDSQVIPISGRGIIEWKRLSNCEGYLDGLGISFTYLEDDSRSQIIKYISKNPNIPSIPSGKKAG